MVKSMGKSNAINLDPQNIRKLQLDMLKLLVEFDRICRKHKIRYFLSCGTLLGAVRHQGFIPWDDDADVEMLREDYEKFCQVCETEIDSEHFFFQNRKNDLNYNWPYGKLRLKNTAYIRAGQTHLTQKTGICIDVFILDDIPDNILIQHFMEKTCLICRKILWSSVGAVTIENRWQRYLFKLMNCIPKKIVLDFFEKFVTQFRNRNMKFLAFHNTGVRTKRGYAFKREWYDKSLDFQFEGKLFPVPAGYHENLYLKYGDYMKYPQIEDQHGNSEACYIKFSDGMELKSI